MMKKLKWILFAVMLTALPDAWAQSDIKLASLPTNAPPRIYRDRIEPHWFADAGGATNKFWYRVDLADGQREFILVDAVNGTRKPAFDHARLAEVLARETGKPADAKRLPFKSVQFSPDGKTMAFRGDTTNGNVNLESYTITLSRKACVDDEILSAGKTPHPSRSGGTETSIKFVNRLKQEVNVFWVDGDGKRQPYGSLAAGEDHEYHTYVGHVWLIAAKNGDVLAVFEAEEKTGLGVIDGNAPTAPPQRAREGDSSRESDSARSPDKKWEILVRGHNLFLRDTGSGAEQQLTYDSNPDNSYARNAEADRAIEMNYESRDPEHPMPEVYWSPDSKHFVAMRHKAGTQRRVYAVESSPEDQLQPKLVSFPYLKPGDEVPYAKPHLFDVEAKKEIPVSDALFANPWSISDLRWETNSARFTFLFNQRGHQVLRLLGVDARTGSVQPIVEEQSKTFICYSAKYFAEPVDETGEIIWMSERDGWNHLYLYDARTGRVKNQITKGEWVVRGVDRVDHEKRQIWFQAGGLHPAEDPYYVHYCRINFDGSGLTVLTKGDGTHTIQLSPDNRFLIDTWSRVDLPPVNELRRTEDGKLVCRLEETDAGDLFASGWKTPERFVAKGRDGVTDIYGVIVRPGNFTPGKKYPVIENIYAGPQDSFVPKAFGTDYQMQKLANRGFIVVQMDGMGTSNRSKKFHDVCWKNLADSGFPDRILWIKAAAAKYPCMDLTRVGIYGTSAGGQSALRGLLDHGDFYKAGVADSGCHDNRMDKIWWNEQWLGWPVDESYVRSSNVADAHKLQGKLLLMAGEMDKNVDPATTMQVVNALVKADKDFELLIMPGVGHGVARTPYGVRRLSEFFMRTLQSGQNQNQSP
jgi:dipeptidyl-peptidase-4